MLFSHQRYRLILGIPIKPKSNFPRYDTSSPRALFVHLILTIHVSPHQRPLSLTIRPSSPICDYISSVCISHLSHSPHKPIPLSIISHIHTVICFWEPLLRYFRLRARLRRRKSAAWLRRRRSGPASCARRRRTRTTARWPASCSSRLRRWRRSWCSCRRCRRTRLRDTSIQMIASLLSTNRSSITLSLSLFIRVLYLYMCMFVYLKFIYMCVWS